MAFDYFALIGDIGFPIVAFFLMYRLVDGTVKKNTEAIKELKEAILKTRKFN